MDEAISIENILNALEGQQSTITKLNQKLEAQDTKIDDLERRVDDLEAMKG